MKKETITIQKEVFIANDGTTFNDEGNCICYEHEKEQEKLEKLAEETLGVKTHADFPSMLNLKYDHEYKLFLIKNEQDLDMFIKTYEYWFTNLKSYWQVCKETFVYPEILCILDFPTGSDTYRLYRMSQLCNQFNAFVNEILEKIEEKMGQPNVNPDDDSQNWEDKIVIASEYEGWDENHLVMELEVKPGTNIEEAVKAACREYCLTDEGRKTYEHNCNSFNWGDFDAYVPNSICEKYGIRKKISDAAVQFNFDQQLIFDEDIFPEE